MKSCLEKIKCPICEREITKINLSKHLKAHEKGNVKNKEICKHTVCQYCKKEFTTASGCGVHECYCLKNPNHKTKLATKGSFWKKGLTSKTSELVAKSQAKLREYYKTHLGPQTGKPISDEVKKKISESRKKYLNEHPDKVPFKLNHSSKESYPEKYFRKWLTKNNLLEKQELQVSRYTLDFAWENNKIYLEIDGSQHKLEWMQEHDKTRTDFLAKLGWVCIDRVDWPEYQKLNKHQKHLYLQELKNKIISSILSPRGSTN